MANFLAPNTETDIILTTIKLTRIESPYTSKCVYGYTEEMKEKLPENVLYSETTCKNICLFTYVEKVCNCSDPLLMEARINPSFAHATFCSIKYSNEDRKCADQAVETISNFSCICGQACDTLVYQVKITGTFQSLSRNLKSRLCRLPSPIHCGPLTNTGRSLPKSLK